MKKLILLTSLMILFSCSKDEGGSTDNVPPSITLIGGSQIEVTAGESFIDPGATAIDDVDGNITNLIQVTGAVDTNQVGTYSIVYSVSDSSGNSSSVSRTVVVVEALPTRFTELHNGKVWYSIEFQQYFALYDSPPSINVFEEGLNGLECVGSGVFGEPSPNGEVILVIENTPQELLLNFDGELNVSLTTNSGGNVLSFTYLDGSGDVEIYTLDSEATDPCL